MSRTTDRARAAARHRVASMAHATAHEVTALREAMQRIRKGEDAVTVIAAMVVERTERISAAANEVMAHG